MLDAGFFEICQEVGKFLKYFKVHENARKRHNVYIALIPFLFSIVFADKFQLQSKESHFLGKKATSGPPILLFRTFSFS